MKIQVKKESRLNFRKKARCSGESIVEVMVAAVIFLMLVAVLQGAVMFCNMAQKKSQQLRQDTASICQSLHEPSKVTTSSDGNENFEFYAVSADGKIEGNMVFSVSAPKQKKTVKYDDAEGAESSVVFYMFGAAGGVTQ